MKKTPTQTKLELDIKSIVDQYRLEVNGVRFWSPYPYSNLTLEHRQEYSGRPPEPPPFKGRGTPKEIKQLLLEKLGQTNQKFSSGEEYRAFMADLRLGVDCTGFTYYVLDQYLQANFNQKLQDHIYKSRQELLEKFYDNPKLPNPPDLPRSKVVNYPDWVSLSQIQTDWGNTPRFVIGAELFVNLGTSKAVTLEQLQSGDLIGMMGHDGIGHHLVVIKAKGNEIIYAHSAGRHGDKNGFGGVAYGQVKITDSDKSIEKQAWSDQLILQEHDFNAQPLRRLKVLDIG